MIVTASHGGRLVNMLIPHKINKTIAELRMSGHEGERSLLDLTSGKVLSGSTCIFSIGTFSKRHKNCIRAYFEFTILWWVHPYVIHFFKIKLRSGSKKITF